MPAPHGSRYAFLLAGVFLLFHALPATQAAMDYTFTYDTTSNCTTGCSFLLPSLWKGGNGNTPGPNDTVLIAGGSEPATILIDSFVEVHYLTLFGNVTLLVTNTFNTTYLLWNGTSVVQVEEGGSVNSWGLGGGTMVTTNGFISSFVTVFDSLYTTMSTFVLKNDLFVGQIYAYGGVLPSTVRISTYGSFNNFTNLQISLLVITNANVEINDCNSTLREVVLIGSTLSYTSQSPATQQGYINFLSYVAGSGPYVLQLGDGFNLTLDHGYIHTAALGDNSILNFVGTTIGNHASVIEFQQTGNAIIQIMGILYIYGNTSFSGTINLANNSMLSMIADFTVTSNVPGVCPIFGLGGIQLDQFGVLTCPGALQIGYVQLLVGSLKVDSLRTPYLVVTEEGYLRGNVVVEDVLDVGSFFLFIDGNYTQSTGTISFSRNAIMPMLGFIFTSNQTVSLSNLVISMNNFETSAEGVTSLTVPLISSADLQTQNISIADELLDSSRFSVGLVIGNSTLSAQYARKSTSRSIADILEDNWVYVVIAGCVLLVLIFMCVAQRIKAGRRGYQPVTKE